MTKTITTEEITTALATGTRKLGALVYWRGLADVHVERDMFRDGFKLAGLSKAVAKTPKPEKLLNQAATTATRSEGKDTARVELKAKIKGSTATYAVCMRRDAADRRRYLEEAQISIVRDDDLANPYVQTDAHAPVDDARDRVIAAVCLAFQEFRQFVHTQEFSETLARSMDLVGALSLRTGVYFVPAESLATVRMVKAFVEENTTAKLTCWEIAATDENGETAKQDANESLRERLAELVTEVKAFTSGCTPEDVADNGHGARSVNARIRRFHDLDARVSLWADILGDYQADLHTAIASAKTTLLGAYFGEIDDEMSSENDDEEIAA